jgi:drug/metabolite transporter (DMT)-like permease
MSSGCVQTLLLTTSNCIMWTINSISFWQVGIKMSNYPLFANWIGIVPYLFIIPFIFFDKSPKSWKKHCLYILCALFSTSDSVLEILADSSTGGVVQAICATAIPIPLTGILTWIVFKRRPTLFETIGSLIVIGASALLIFESEGIYVDWWITGYITGLMFGCVSSIIWEYMFIEYTANVFHLLAWTTLYSLPFYFLSIFIDGSQTFSKESNGFKCLFGTHAPIGCLSNAWIPATIYSLSSLASDIIQMYFVKQDSAFFLIMADTLTTPLTAIIMSFTWLFGNAAEPLTWYSTISCILVVLGIIVYKIGDKLCKRKMDPLSE